MFTEFNKGNIKDLQKNNQTSIKSLTTPIDDRKSFTTPKSVSTKVVPQKVILKDPQTEEDCKEKQRILKFIATILPIYHLPERFLGEYYVPFLENKHSFEFMKSLNPNDLLNVTPNVFIDKIPISSDIRTRSVYCAGAYILRLDHVAGIPIPKDIDLRVRVKLIKWFAENRNNVRNIVYKLMDREKITDSEKDTLKCIIENISENDDIAGG